MQTQWYVGMNGPTGLRYSVLHHKMDRMGLSKVQYEQLEDDIRTMEFAALSAMHEKA